MRPYYHLRVVFDIAVFVLKRDVKLQLIILIIILGVQYDLIYVENAVKSQLSNHDK